MNTIINKFNSNVSEFLYKKTEVNRVLNENMWNHSNSTHAYKIFNALKDQPEYINSTQFLNDSTKLFKEIKRDNHLLLEGKVYQAYKSVFRHDFETVILDQWFQSNKMGEVFDKGIAIQNLKNQQSNVYKKHGYSIQFYILEEQIQLLNKDISAFCLYQRQVSFAQARLEKYDKVQTIDELKQLEAFDLEWIPSVIDTSYQLNAYIGQIHQKARTLNQELNQLPKKEKAAVFTCSYGGGHNATAQAVKSYIDDTYDVSIIDPSTDVFLETQWIHQLGKKLGKNEWKDPDVFNFVLKNQLYKYDNMYREISTVYNQNFRKEDWHAIFSKSPHSNSEYKSLIRMRLLRERPKQIITSYHMALHPIREVAEEMGIPVLHVATDYDTKAIELYPMKNVPKLKHFLFCGPLNYAKVEETMNPMPIENKRISGFPVRKEFLNTTDTQTMNQMKKERNLGATAKVVLIMGGGGGQKVPFPELISKFKGVDDQLHVVVIAGANKEFGDEVKNMKSNNQNITFETAKGDDPDKPYFVSAKKINELMDLANVVITKSGGASTGEAMQKGIPILFDHRQETFPWEEYNIQVVKEFGRGESITQLAEFEEQLKSNLTKPKSNTDLPNPMTNIRQFVSEMQQNISQDNEYQEKQKEYTF